MMVFFVIMLIILGQIHLFEWREYNIMAWICKQCAMVNTDAAYKCIQCGSIKPTVKPISKTDN
jgi:ribosomal protein L40E